mmetsp:Transcript_51101/g.119790  ORF Transcript_51101/g.119790 Transcript_51101/m.119790 type:complete len:218 (+) Transcript_51101:133-786(+)
MPSNSLTDLLRLLRSHSEGRSARYCLGRRGLVIAGVPLARDLLHGLLIHLKQALAPFSLCQVLIFWRKRIFGIPAHSPDRVHLDAPCRTNVTLPELHRIIQPQILDETLEGRGWDSLHGLANLVHATQACMAHHAHGELLVATGELRDEDIHEQKDDQDSKAARCCQKNEALLQLLQVRSWKHVDRQLQEGHQAASNALKILWVAEGCRHAAAKSQH